MFNTLDEQAAVFYWIRGNRNRPDCGYNKYMVYIDNNIESLEALDTDSEKTEQTELNTLGFGNDIADVRDLLESNSRTISGPLSVDRAKILFEIIYRSDNLRPAEKIRISRDILRSQRNESFVFKAEIGNRIRNWIRRWHRHDAAARLMAASGPFNIAVTVRFQRNYRKAECNRLTVSFFKALSGHLPVDSTVYEITGFGTTEPDYRPIQKDSSFHTHAGLLIPGYPTPLVSREQLDQCVTKATDSIVDSKGRPAIRRREVAIKEIYDEFGWCIYCTKESEDSSEFMSSNSFEIDKGSPRFLGVQ